MHDLMWLCKGKPEGRNSVLDFISVCQVTSASHLTMMGHLKKILDRVREKKILVRRRF